jgi:hypothetical protein
MISTNAETLVEVRVVGEISHPLMREGQPYDVGYDGTPFLSIGMYGITTNVKVGDPAFSWAWGEHIEPGVSIRNSEARANAALNNLACVGNEAVIISACMDSKERELKGATGVITGKHGGVNHVIAYFPKKILEHLCIGDKVQIKACGVGLRFSNYPDITIMNCSFTLLKALNPVEKAGRIRIQVAKIVPGKLMGSGLGSTCSFLGDYDVQSTSPDAIKEFGLDTLRLGDVIAITDHDCTYGPRWQDGAMTVGVVIHGSSRLSGHGPGVCVLMTSPKRLIEPIISRRANLEELLKLS